MEWENSFRMLSAGQDHSARPVLMARQRLGVRRSHLSLVLAVGRPSSSQLGAVAPRTIVRPKRA
jgi:hypothetical protein